MQQGPAMKIPEKMVPQESVKTPCLSSPLGNSFLINDFKWYISFGASRIFRMKRFAPRG